MKGLLKKARIFREQVKDRHTSHWDLDMLSKEELDALMSAQSGSTDVANLDASKKSRAKG